jgi:hypothetical protein
MLESDAAVSYIRIWISEIRNIIFVVGKSVGKKEMDDGEGGAISCSRELCGCQGVLGGESVEIGTFFTAIHKTTIIMTGFFQK